MAKHQRNASKGKPITSHPLFPTVVALWFGALFGLGSLAVRASLLESLVTRTRLDLIVPAAAPPLGLTARMLVALFMAAFGALAGALIARRITRPSPAVYQRKRETLAAREEDFSVRSLDPAASEPQPVAVAFGEGMTGGDDEASAFTSRRRPLAIEHEEVAYVPHEMAPLPGGQPQILDIAGMNLGEPMGQPLTVPAQFAPEPTAAFAAPLETPLDLGSFAQSAPEDPGFAPQPTVASFDWTQASPITADPTASQPRPAPAMIEQQRQMFQPVAQPADAANLPPRQVFGQAPAEPIAEQVPEQEARQMFGQPAANDHVPAEFVETLGYKASVFDTPEVQPLFPVRPDVAAEAPVAAPVCAEPGITEPQFAEPAAPLPSPASLGMTELASRLAESMQRRRAARAAAAAAAANAAATMVAPAQPSEVPQAAAPSEPEIAVPPPYVPPFAHIEPIDEPLPAPFTRLAEAAAEAPVADSFTVAIDVIQTAPPAPIHVPPAPVAMPAALRPINLDDFTDEGSFAMLDSLLPPRSLGEMAAPEAPAPQAAAPEAIAPDAVAEPEIAEEDDTNYGSLLGLGSTASRNPFVRIDEPESAGETIEPVVIFPGQAARGDEEAGRFRRFDAPGQAEQGQMVAAPGQNPQTDPDEAERALRAALANLQRISGAA